MQIHVYLNWKTNFNSKNSRKRSFSYETKASITGGDQLEQTPISNYSCDPLQGIGGPMTRAKTKRIEQAL